MTSNDIDDLTDSIKNMRIITPEEETTELRFHVENNAYDVSILHKIYIRYTRYITGILFHDTIEIEKFLKNKILKYINLYTLYANSNQTNDSSQYIQELISTAIEIDTYLYEIISY